MSGYKQIREMEHRLLDAEPGEELQSFYRRISQAGSALRYNLDVLRNRLTENRGGHPGPFFCDLETFREFYHIQTRNLERLGSTIFLGMIMLGDGDAAREDPILYKGAIAALEEILRRNLRRGSVSSISSIRRIRGRGFPSTPGLRRWEEKTEFRRFPEILEFFEKNRKISRNFLKKAPCNCGCNRFCNPGMG